MNNLNEKEEGDLFGLFEGDGYKLYDKKSRHYQVEYYLNSLSDKPIISYLISLLNKLCLRYFLYQDKRFNCKRIRVYSKHLFEIIDKNILIESKSNDFCLGYVSGLIDSEGYVNNKKGYIMVINTNYSALDQCKRFLEKEGVSSSIKFRKLSKKDKKKSYRMYISVSFKNKPNLSIKTKKAG